MSFYVFSNIGFNEDNAQYTVQQSGIYAVDFNILLSGLSASQTVTGNILRNGVSTMSSMTTYGAHKTVGISSLAYLLKNQVFSTSVSSVTAGHLNGATMEGGYSIYFLKSINDVTGKSHIGLFIHFLCMSISFSVRYIKTYMVQDEGIS